MINIFTGYIARIAGTAMISGAIISMAGKGASSGICKLAGALLIISTVVTPIRSIRWNFADFFESTGNNLEARIQDAESRYRQLTDSVVINKIQSYAEEEAKKKGIEAQIKITAYTDENNVFNIDSALVEYADYQSFTRAAEVEKILTEECGIPKESQKHYYER